MNRSNEILKLIDGIGEGHHVYSGMVHQTRAIAYLTQALKIADEIEQREYQNAKRIDELNNIVESHQFQYQALCDKYYAEKDKLTQNIQSIRSELNTTRDERDTSRKLFTEWHEKAISMRKQPSELETLRSENALLSERVKELDEIDEKNKRQIELLRFRANELTEKLNVASENNHKIGKSNIRLEETNRISRLRANLMWDELSALKESKTVYVRRK